MERSTLFPCLSHWEAVLHLVLRCIVMVWWSGAGVSLRHLKYVLHFILYVKISYILTKDIYIHQWISNCENHIGKPCVQIYRRLFISSMQALIPTPDVLQHEVAVDLLRFVVRFCLHGIFLNVFFLLSCCKFMPLLVSFQDEVWPWTCWMCKRLGSL